MNAPERYELFILEDGQKKVVSQRETNLADAAQFVIQKEDHTLGNLLRMQLLLDPNVLFAGYKVPHPLENFIVVKVRTTPKTTPEKVLSDSCTDLISELTFFEEAFQEEVQR
jgi:DNA-directed RNA polymerase II subunit RPB11